MRFGKKGYPTYRIVALDKRSKRDGAYIEKVGLYNPMSKTATLTIDEERLSYWLKIGAVVSEGMKKILSSRNPKQKKIVKKATKKEPVKEVKTAKTEPKLPKIKAVPPEKTPDRESKETKTPKNQTSS